MLLYYIEYNSVTLACVLKLVITVQIDYCASESRGLEVTASCEIYVVHNIFIVKL